VAEAAVGPVTVEVGAEPVEVGAEPVEVRTEPVDPDGRLDNVTPAWRQRLLANCSAWLRSAGAVQALTMQVVVLEMKDELVQRHLVSEALQLPKLAPAMQGKAHGG
jgi:hypothetical protein